MANEESGFGFDLTIRTTAAGEGAEKTAADLAKVKTGAAEAAAATRELTAAQKEEIAAFASTGTYHGAHQPDLSGYSKQELDNIVAEVAASKQLEASTGTRAAQEQAIADLILKQKAARAAGNGEEAEALNQQIVTLSEALSLQKQRNISEAESLELARQGNATRLASSQATAAGQEKEIVAEKELTDIEIQRQAIVTSRLELASLRAAGQTEEAAALDREIEQMTLSVQLQKQLNISQDEANAQAAEYLAAQEAIAAAKAAQAEADAADADTAPLRGIGMAGRAGNMMGSLLGMGSAVAGEIGFAVFAVYELGRALFSMGKASDEANKKLEAIGGTSSALKDKIHGLEDEEDKLPASAAKWEGALKLVNQRLSEAEKSLGRQFAAQNQIAEAEERLAIARIKASSMTDDQKDAAIAKTQQDFDDKKAQAQTDYNNAQIKIEQEKVRQAADHSARQDFVAAQAKKEADAEAAHLDAMRKQLKEIKAEAGTLPSHKSAFGAGADETLAFIGGAADSDTLTGALGAGEKEVAGTKADIAKRLALEKEAKDLAKQIKQDEKRAGTDAANARKQEETAQRMRENIQTQQEESQSKIADLDSENATSATVGALDKQTAGATAQTRENAANAKAAKEGVAAAAKLAREQKEHQREQDEAARKEKEQEIRQLEEQVTELEAQKTSGGGGRGRGARGAAQGENAGIQHQVAELRAQIAGIRAGISDHPISDIAGQVTGDAEILAKVPGATREAGIALSALQKAIADNNPAELLAAMQQVTAVANDIAQNQSAVNQQTKATLRNIHGDIDKLRQQLSNNR